MQTITINMQRIQHTSIEYYAYAVNNAGNSGNFPQLLTEKESSDTIIVYQTYEDADVNHLYAKMYTHSSHGGESKMGYIKFRETEDGLKMMVDLKDMRPNVPYSVRLYKCGSCHNDVRCCNANKAMNIKLPILKTGASGHLKETYMIHGLDASRLDGANVYLERDGGYKAGWGKLEK
jgi:Cu/Zn superoxide dismutase